MKMKVVSRSDKRKLVVFDPKFVPRIGDKVDMYDVPKTVKDVFWRPGTQDVSGITTGGEEVIVMVE